jgi:hypothetical protein
MKPIIQALLLADNVYTDAETGKRVIAGVFDSITVPEIPGHFLKVTCAYVSLTELRGRVEVMLRYVDLDSNEVLMENGPTIIEQNDPIASVDFAVAIPPLPVPHEGIFALEVHANDELIGMLRITAASGEHGEEDDESGGHENE